MYGTFLFTKLVRDKVVKNLRSTKKFYTEYRELNKQNFAAGFANKIHEEARTNPAGR